MIGHKDQQRIGIGIFEVVFDGGEFVIVLAAAIKVLDATNEEDLERRHQRGRARLIQHLLQVHLARSMS